MNLYPEEIKEEFEEVIYISPPCNLVVIMWLLIIRDIYIKKVVLHYLVYLISQ